MADKYVNDDGSPWTPAQYQAWQDYQAQEVRASAGDAADAVVRKTMVSTGRRRQVMPSTIGMYGGLVTAKNGAGERVEVLVNNDPANNNITWFDVYVYSADDVLVHQGKATPEHPFKIDHPTMYRDDDDLVVEADLHTFQMPRIRDVQRVTFPGWYTREPGNSTPPPVVYEDKCVPPGNLNYFRPNAGITRAQVCKMIAEALGWNEDPGEQLFEDVPPTSPHYAYVQRMARRGIIGGYKCKP